VRAKPSRRYSLFSILYSLKGAEESMAYSSPLLEKSLHFAARIVKLYQYLSKEKKETAISKQIIRSGTSIGANANEAVYGVSQADFIAKLQISLKETAETEYWLRLLLLSEYIDEKEAKSLIDDCLEIKRILIASLKTAKDKNK
jgi:four helix bundle protein